MAPSSIDVLVPFWGLAGGVIKVLDYADHASQLGLDVRIWAPPMPTDDQAVLQLPVVERLRAASTVEIGLLDELSVDSSDAVLFTDPTHHELIERSTSRTLGGRLMHLVQGTRHGNPRWQGGRNYRLLHRPMTRISVSHEVTAAIGPLVNTRYQLHTIVEGHDVDYFSNRPSAAPSTSAPIRVLYTTWKSNLGDRIQEQFPDGENSRSVAWIAVREPLGWPALRNRYHGADIFVCAPGPEEGFYLPGLEAMAAGAAVVTAIVGGNAAYARDGQNAIVADYDDVGSHIDALQVLIGDAELRAAVVNGGRATTEAHRLDRERSEFADVLATVGP